MNVSEFRKLALSMPEAIESSHLGTPDFRAGGKIFATLYGQTKNQAMVKLTPVQQAAFIADHPDMFEPIKGGWGRQGATAVNLTEADESVLRTALRTAWRNCAPKRLLDESIFSPAQARMKPRKTRKKKGGKSP